MNFLHEVEDPKQCQLQSIRVCPCGFCGQDGCVTQLKERKKGGLSIISNCPYHYVGMNYKSAAKFSKSSPCTNIPIHCPLCPTSISGDPPTIWKYNPLYHLASEHSTGSTPSAIPGQLLVQIFISKEEERTLGIQEVATNTWREENNIPDSDSFQELLQNIQKRDRSDTVSTAFSDSHDPKRYKLGGIQE